MNMAQQWRLPLRRHYQLALIVAALGLCPSAAFAHNFASGQGAYEDFLSGSEAVLVDLPIILGLIASGIFVGIWRTERLPKVWIFFIIGILVGMVVGLIGFLPPVLPAYLAICIIGLLGAAAPNISVSAMRLIICLMGLILANAVLSGHTVDEIQPLAYLGIFFAMNLGLAASAGIVTISQEKLNYGWVYISWRALSSWLVAISVMAMVLMFAPAG